MTPDYPHITKSLDTITPISAVLERVWMTLVMVRYQMICADSGWLAVR